MGDDLEHAVRESERSFKRRYPPPPATMRILVMPIIDGVLQRDGFDLDVPVAATGPEITNEIKGAVMDRVAWHWCLAT